MGFKISDTRLIYRFDPFNKVNFHHYIDSKEHLVLVIKINNGVCIAGYTEGSFRPKTTADKTGLIMSLTRKKCYFQIEHNKKAIIYDDFYVIFGNSEIRIKALEKKMLSNFGISSSYYHSNGDSVALFTGGSSSSR